MNSFFDKVWLIVRNDLRLMRRETKFGDYLGWALTAVISFCIHLAVLAFCLLVKHPGTGAAEAVMWWFFTFVMLGMAMNTAISLLFEKSDFDLLLSSPISGRAVLLARLASIAAVAFLSVVIFVPAAVDIMSIFFTPKYLAGYLLWPALAIGAAAAGTAFTLGLVRLLGARRARTVGQVIATLLGGSVFIISQIPSMLTQSVGFRRLGAVFDRLENSPIFLFPARAGRGDLASLGIVLLGVAIAVGLAVWLLSRVFVSGLQDAGAIPAKPVRQGRHRWSEGLMRATFWKELRLIARDPMLLAQTLPQMIYVVPVGASFFRGLGLGALAPAGFMVAITLSSSLAAVAAAGEDCWDLIRMSPSKEVQLRNAKIAAAMAIPLLIVMAIDLGLAVTGKPRLAVLALALSAACSAAMCRVGISEIRPRPRGDILRRRTSGSGTMTPNFVQQMLGTFFFLGTGGGALILDAWGKAPWVEIALIALALAGSLACLVYVRFREVVWGDRGAMSL